MAGRLSWLAKISTSARLFMAAWGAFWVFPTIAMIVISLGNLGALELFWECVLK
jgi:hypothetical protein